MGFKLKGVKVKQLLAIYWYSYIVLDVSSQVYSAVLFPIDFFLSLSLSLSLCVCMCVFMLFLSVSLFSVVLSVCAFPFTDCRCLV